MHVCVSRGGFLEVKSVPNMLPCTDDRSILLAYFRYFSVSRVNGPEARKDSDTTEAT